MDTKKDSWVFTQSSVYSPTCKGNGGKTYAKSAHNGEMVSVRGTIPQIALKGVCKILVNSSNSVEDLERPPILDHMLHADVKGLHALPVPADLDFRFRYVLHKAESSFDFANRRVQLCDCCIVRGQLGWHREQEYDLAGRSQEGDLDYAGTQGVGLRGACARRVRGLGRGHP